MSNSKLSVTNLNERVFLPQAKSKSIYAYIYSVAPLGDSPLHSASGVPALSLCVSVTP